MTDKAPVEPDMGASRADAGKPRYDLIPPEFMEALAIHYAQGARKYADRNWERGMSWSRCFRPLMSHAWKWFRGETYDEDPTMPGYKAHHMVAVAWNAIALYTYDVRKMEGDDRPVRGNDDAEGPEGLREEPGVLSGTRVIPRGQT